MLDLLLGLALLGALLSGYRRGFIRSAVRLAVLVAALWTGYRVGPAGAGLAESWTGTDPLASRWISSAAIFLVILAAGNLAARRLADLLGSLHPVDRIAGGLLSGAGFAAVAALLLLLAAAVPSPPPWMEGYLAESRAARLVEEQAAAAAPALSRMLGDRLLESYVNITRYIGEAQAVVEGEDRVDFPAADTASLTDRPAAAAELFDLLNMTRIEDGAGAVAWSEALAKVAGRHGREMYEEGFFSHASPATGMVGARLQAEGIPFRAAGENLALSPTVDTAHEGLLASPSHRAAMLDPIFTRVGISAIEGPMGLMVVQVFTG